MVKVFLDTNILIDLVEKRGTITAEKLDQFSVVTSPLSVHILLYITKQKVPYPKLLGIIDQFSLIPFDEVITMLALKGPTKDFEDNVQLHSAAHSDCEMFVTSDKKLLSLKFFGKLQIISPAQLT